MRYTPPIKGKALKKSVKTPAPYPASDFGSVSNLVYELRSLREDVIGTVDKELEKVDEKLEKFDDKIEEVNQTVKEIKALEKGDKGEDADEQKIADWVLSQIRQPEDGKDADEEEIVTKVLSRLPKLPNEKEIVTRVMKQIPEAKTSLKVIREELKLDKEELLEEILKSPKLKLKVENVEGLKKTLDVLDRRYIHGGGDTISAGTNVTITNVNGTKQINATGGGTGTVTDVSVATANGLSGTVANSTTTPAITLDISGLNATKIADGSVTSVEFQYLGGVTSDIQTQLDAKGTGNVTKVGTPVNNQVGVWTGDGTLEGDVDLTFDTATNTLTTPTVAANLTGNVTGNVSGTAATVTAAAQPAITSLGTLTTLTVDNITINANTISSSTSLLLDGAVDINVGVITGVTSITSNDYVVATGILPDANDGAYLGQAGTAFSDLFLAEGGVINWDSSDVTLTQTGNVLAVAGGDLRVATADVGTNADSVPTLSSTNTLTNKTLTAPTINAATLNGTITLTESTSIALDPAQSDQTWTGITRTGTAGATLAFGQLVYLAAADSRWELADADSATTSDRLLGMVVLAAAADGDPTNILLMGNIRADSQFPAMTIGSALYVGESAGAIQVAIPTGADNVIRRVGYALTADELYFAPSMDSQITVA